MMMINVCVCTTVVVSGLGFCSSEKPVEFRRTLKNIWL